MELSRGVKWILFGSNIARDLLQGFIWHATAAVGYSFRAAGLELVLGQDETLKHLAWTSGFSLQICLGCAELLAKRDIAPGR